jgi:hypothetical protein
MSKWILHFRASGKLCCRDLRITWASSAPSQHLAAKWFLLFSCELFIGDFGNLVALFECRCGEKSSARMVGKVARSYSNGSGPA